MTDGNLVPDTNIHADDLLRRRRHTPTLRCATTVGVHSGSGDAKHMFHISLVHVYVSKYNCYICVRTLASVVYAFPSHSRC